MKPGVRLIAFICICATTGVWCANNPAVKNEPKIAPYTSFKNNWYALMVTSATAPDWHFTTNKKLLFEPQLPVSHEKQPPARLALTTTGKEITLDNGAVAVPVAHIHGKDLVDKVKNDPRRIDVRWVPINPNVATWPKGITRFRRTEEERPINPEVIRSLDALSKIVPPQQPPGGQKALSQADLTKLLAQLNTQIAALHQRTTRRAAPRQ